VSVLARAEHQLGVMTVVTREVRVEEEERKSLD